MYFFQQLKRQFLHTLTLNVGEEPHALDGYAADDPEDTTVAPKDQEDFTQEEISKMSSSEILLELKERLDTLKAGEKIVGTRAEVLMRFCMKVQNNEVHGYTTADTDYMRLVEMVQLAVVEHRGLVDEAGEISEKIRVELARIGGEINKEIKKPEGNIVLTEQEIRQQEEILKLEIQRFSYEGILQEQVSEYSSEQQDLFNAQTKDIKNNILGLTSDKVPEDLDRKGKIEWLQGKNKEILVLLQQFTHSIENPDVIINRLLNLQEKAELDRMEALYNELHTSLNKKLEPYINEETTPESIKSIIETNDQISKNKEIFTDSQKLDYYSRSGISELKRLHIDLDIAIRDKLVVGKDGETLGDVRDSLIEKKFQEIKDSGTDIQKNIIGEKSFSEITSSDFATLAQSGTDLSEFLLIDEKGEAFSGEFSQGQEFIMNAGGRDDLGGYLTGYIFDFQNVKNITVGGTEYMRDINGVPSKGFVDSEGNAIGSIQDGQVIAISSIEAISDKDFSPLADELRQSYNYDRGGDLTADLARQFEENPELNSFSFKDFMKALLSGNLTAIAKQLEYIMNGIFHKDTEAQEWSQFDEATGENIPVSEADLSIASLESFPGPYRANLVRTCRESGISVDDFVAQMNAECQSNGFPPNRFISLIGHESGWKSWAQNPTSSAFGLGQMIDSTWAAYANGGDRRNPIDQMKASVQYLKHIMRVRDCSPEDACAFYNTGEGFNISNGPAPASYVRQNGVIVNKIPDGMRSNGITSREYFIGAVAYYNDMSFSEANDQSRFGIRV